MKDKVYIDNLAKDNGFSVVGITNVNNSYFIQSQLDEFYIWADNNRLIFNSLKFQLIIFQDKKKAPASEIWPSKISGRR